MRATEMPAGRSHGRLTASVAMVIALLLAGCRPAPRPIAEGNDSCAFCRMEISDARYAAELVTRRGKVYTFDSIECLVGYYLSLDGTDRAGVESMWVSDYTRPHTLVPAATAAFVRISGPGSPMGRGMLAVARASDLTTVRGQTTTPEMDWKGVLALAVREHWQNADAMPMPTASMPAASPAGAHAWVVGAGGAESARTLGEAIREARPGDTIIVRPGVYREPMIVVDRPLTLIGEGQPTLDGQGSHQIMTITADDVTVRGLRFAHVGTSYTEDRAALKIVGARGCAIEDNEVDDAFFGIYLDKTTDCRVEGNTIRGQAARETSSGNGIHLWSSQRIVVANNRVSGQRDGIYLEFAHDADVHGNVSEHNLRYGLHFMYSDDCQYRDNTFRENGAGVAVMYAHRVLMTGNRFADNWGGAAYGLLLKEIFDSRWRTTSSGGTRPAC